jgi:hypothetical protein
MRETSDFRMYYYAEKNNFGGAVLCFTNLSCDRLGDTPGGLLWPVFESSLRGRYTLRKHYLRNQATYVHTTFNALHSHVFIIHVLLS